MQALLQQLKNDPKLTPHTTCQHPLNSSSKHFFIYSAASFKQAIQFLTICTQIYSVICSAYSFISTRISQNFISVEICMVGGTQSLGIPARDCFSSSTFSFYFSLLSFDAIKDNLNYKQNKNHYYLDLQKTSKSMKNVEVGVVGGMGLSMQAVILCFYQLSMKHRHLHRNQFVSMSDVTLEDLNALDARQKQMSTFITQKSIPHEEEVQQRHKELNYYLDHLGKKVTEVIQHNEAEVLTAYKKHFTRVKKELQEFKKQSEAQANSSNSFLQKIEMLEKQLVIFRQESLRLFSRVNEKDKTIEQLKFNLQELISEKKHMDTVVKELIKRNRELEGQRERQEGRKYSGDNHTLQINSFTKHFHHKSREKSPFNTLRPSSNTSKAQNSHSYQSRTIAVDQSFQQFPVEPDAIGRRLKQNLPLLDEATLTGIKEVVLELISEQRKRNYQIKARTPNERERYEITRMTNRSRSNYTMDFQESAKQSIDHSSKQVLKRKSLQLANNLQLCEYFKKCIDTVRKQIGRRKNVNTISFHMEGTPIGIEQFKKIDFIRLMELVCSHEQVIMALYNALIEVGR